MMSAIAVDRPSKDLCLPSTCSSRWEFDEAGPTILRWNVSELSVTAALIFGDNR